MNNLMTWFVLLMLLIKLVTASDGDLEDEFRNCLRECQCPADESTRTLLWTCMDTCEYDCMWKRNLERKSTKLPVLQYFGKWPFKAILGMQEPASVLASLGNLVAHLAGIVHFNRSKAAFMSKYYRINAALAVIAWMSAMIFHARDRWWTERADYYSASGLFFWNVAYSVVRVLKLQRTAIAVVSLIMYLYYQHVSYLHSRPRFHYSWNMKVSIGLSATFLGTWFLWSMIHFRRPEAKLSLLFTILMLFAGALEVFDFPPWYDSVDAHALWHFTTIPLTILWYRFLTKDSLRHSKGGSEYDKIRGRRPKGIWAS